MAATDLLDQDHEDCTPHGCQVPGATACEVVDNYDGPTDDERIRFEEQHFTSVWKYRQDLLDAGLGHKIKGL